MKFFKPKLSETKAKPFCRERSCGDGDGDGDRWGFKGQGPGSDGTRLVCKNRIWHRMRPARGGYARSPSDEGGESAWKK